MDTSLLFRKKSQLTEPELSWLNTKKSHAYKARRNLKAVASPSATLIRALAVAVMGGIKSVAFDTEDNFQVGYTRDSSSATHTAYVRGEKWGIPFGEGDGKSLNYGFGILAIVEAILRKDEAQDFLDAYQALVDSYSSFMTFGSNPQPLLQAADELYFWIAYAERDDFASRAERIAIQDSRFQTIPTCLNDLPPQVFTDKGVLQQHRKGQPVNSAPFTPAVDIPKIGFVGWQKDVVTEALDEGDNVLLIGGTGTGKTSLVQEVVAQLSAKHEKFYYFGVDGKAGIEDVDLFGCVMPDISGNPVWFDGPLTEAIEKANDGSFVLIDLDEITRIPARQLGFLAGLMNPKPSHVMRKMGIPDIDDGDFYEVLIPGTHRRVYAPVERVRFIASGNFGSMYTVQDLDAALLRRFQTHVEFHPLGNAELQGLLIGRVGVSKEVARFLAGVTSVTQTLEQNGQLPKSIDTGNVLSWAKKVARQKSASCADIMFLGYITWAKAVCGDVHTGYLDTVNFASVYQEAVTCAKNFGLPIGDDAQLRQRMNVSSWNGLS